MMAYCLAKQVTLVIPPPKKNKQTIKSPKVPQGPKAPMPKIPHPLKNYLPKKNQNLPSPKKIPP